MDNNIDEHVDDEIYNCLNIKDPKSFFLFAGAGSGKTRSLVKALVKFKAEYGREFKLKRKQIAIITYTNAASEEITRRLDYDPIFSVSTIHSFAWEVIKTLTSDIKSWLKENLVAEIKKLEEEQGRSRDLANKTSIDRAKKILSKTRRLQHLVSVKAFTYNPNGNNTTKDSLNHTEVISVTAHFIKTKPLMQKMLGAKFPVILIDESQDTKEELIDAFFEFQRANSKSVTLGLFGDTMQRIYTDGKANIEKNLPGDWDRPAKKMNHRSSKRIIALINNIRNDGQAQIPRVEKEDGYVRLFIIKRGITEKQASESLVKRRMFEITKDALWVDKDNEHLNDVKTLILEHHMAARRMGFLTFFEPLYKVDKLTTGLLDGTLAGASFFTKIILPLIEAKEKSDDFSIARIIKKHSRFLTREEILKEGDQLENIKRARKGVLKLFELWNDMKDPTLIDVLQCVYRNGLFPIPESLLPIASRTNSEQAVADKTEVDDEEEDLGDEVINAWDLALANPFSQIRSYHTYLSEDSKFGTHQGVKGLEFPRVMVILDDEESRGFLFSYDKLFGSKELSAGDLKNLKEGKETGIDRTKRLFYVACSRAEESLAIVAYSDHPEVVRKSALEFGWFKEEEIELILPYD